MSEKIINDVRDYILDMMIKHLFQGEKSVQDSDGETVDVYDTLLSKLDLKTFKERLENAANPTKITKLHLKVNPIVPIIKPKANSKSCNGYNLYCHEEALRIKNAGEKLTVTIHQHFANGWATMDKTIKDDFIARAKLENERNGLRLKKNAPSINGYMLCLSTVPLSKKGLPDGKKWEYGDDAFGVSQEVWKEYKNIFGKENNPLNQLAKEQTKILRESGKVNFRFKDLPKDVQEKALNMLCCENAPLHPDSEYRKSRTTQFVIIN